MNSPSNATSIKRFFPEHTLSCGWFPQQFKGLQSSNYRFDEEEFVKNYMHIWDVQSVYFEIEFWKVSIREPFQRTRRVFV